MTSDNNENIALSVIIPITERYDPLESLFDQYKEGIEACGIDYEVIFVLDGKKLGALNNLKHIREREKITIIILAKNYGEAAALNSAFKQAKGTYFLTLPAYQQVKPSEIPRLVNKIREGNADMVLSRRWPRQDSALNRAQSWMFNSILSSFTDLKIHDAGCGVRAFNKRVVEEVQLYGDMHRFFPVIADRAGMKVIEEKVAQSQSDAFNRIYAPGIYLRRLLDLLTVFFLVKFTKKPLRFFGLIGSTVFTVGVLTTLYIVIERLFFDVPMADRPALFLSSLFMVLGIQIIAIGLIGEIIIFTHAKDIKEYTVEEIIN